MRHIIYIFVIISLSLTVNGQLKTKSLGFEIEKQTVSADPNKNGNEELINQVVSLNEKGVDAALKENDYRKAIDFFRQAAELDFPDVLFAATIWANRFWNSKIMTRLSKF